MTVINSTKVLIAENIEPTVSDTNETENLASSKEKTPMTRINELARSHKVKLNYMLSGEDGPSHKKVFYVTLTLTGEQILEQKYYGNGPTMKQAQHDAAISALKETKLQVIIKYKPTSKSSGYIAPSCRLNSLVMKYGIPVQYEDLESTRSAVLQKQTVYNDVGKLVPCFKTMQINNCELTMGRFKFTGHGGNKQFARNSAAKKALVELNLEPDLLESLSVTRSELPTSPALVEKSLSMGPDLKNRSVITLVYELAELHKLTIEFQIISESGPSHLRMFGMKCICSNDKLRVESQIAVAESKKMAKKKSAILIYEQLAVLPAPNVTIVRKTSNRSKSNKNANKKPIAKAKSLPQVEVNPITKLSQYRQSLRESEPVYTLDSQVGNKRPEFTIKVTVDNDVFSLGKGTNKKTAKQRAATALLILLGVLEPVVDAPMPAHPLKSSLKEGNQSSPDSKHVTFNEIYDTQYKHWKDTKSQRVTGNQKEDVKVTTNGIGSATTTTTGTVSDDVFYKAADLGESSTCPADTADDVPEPMDVSTSTPPTNESSNHYRAINGLFRSRTDYSLDKLAAGELLAQGYSPTLQKMYASQCSVDCPLVGSIEQLDYLRNVLGLEVVIKLNANGKYNMSMYSRDCNDKRPIVSTCFDRTTSDEQRCSHMLTKLASLPDNYCIYKGHKANTEIQ